MSAVETNSFYHLKRRSILIEDAGANERCRGIRATPHLRLLRTGIVHLINVACC